MQTSVKASTHRFKASDNGRAFLDGLRDGTPIALGYFAVSFSLGIAARSIGLTPFQGFLASITTLASAGQYAVFILIGANAAYLEVVIATLVVNARYLLMSCSLSQKFKPGTPLRHRLGVGFGITDEIFGITVGRPGPVNPYYNYGALLIAAPCWAAGTALGIIAGNILPPRVTSALNVALFGMFLAVIIPPARKNRVVAVLVAVSFAASCASMYLPLLSGLSDGTRTIVLTVALSALAALFFPVKREETIQESSTETGDKRPKDMSAKDINSTVQNIKEEP